MALKIDGEKSFQRKIQYLTAFFPAFYVDSISFAISLVVIKYQSTNGDDLSFSVGIGYAERHNNNNHETGQYDRHAATGVEEVKPMAKQRAFEQLLTEGKKILCMANKYAIRSKQDDVDKNNTRQWIRSSELNTESKGFNLAARYQILLTRFYQNYKI